MATSRVASFSAGDVVIVPFPYSDRLAQKRRPALVVSSDAVHGLGLVWVIMITSAKNSAQLFDVPIADLVRAGLPASSVARPTKIACVEPSIIVRVAGKLSAVETASLRLTLRSFLGGRA